MNSFCSILLHNYGFKQKLQVASSYVLYHGSVFQLKNGGKVHGIMLHVMAYMHRSLLHITVVNDTIKT